MKKSMHTFCLGVLTIASLLMAPLASAQDGDIPRTRDGKPDFSGTYDVSTLTPFQRPSQFGNRLILTDDEAFAIREPTVADLAGRFVGELFLLPLALALVEMEDAFLAAQ